MEESAVAYAALLESLVKGVFTHIYKTCKWQSNCPNVKVGELEMIPYHKVSGLWEELRIFILVEMV